jgi:purine-nucleoside phosphorylase
MYAERPEDIAQWTASGYLGVEMETAMVFALSHHFSIPAVSIIYVADNLIEDQTMYSSDFVADKERRKAIKQLQYDVAVRVLVEK